MDTTSVPKQDRTPLLAGDGVTPARWEIASAPVDYPYALDEMQAHAAAIARGEAGERIWLLEHPALFTAGTSAKPEDLLDANALPVFKTGRGGQYTYHGPGQRIAYVMLDLRTRGRDIRALVNGLEQWVIDTLERFNIKGERREGAIGVWVKRPEKGPQRYDKISAIGVRVSRWVSYHGISLNVSPDLSHYAGIVPCGIADQDVTSFEDLGQIVSMEEVDIALRECFEPIFGPVSAR
ncbi:lipoyl(octanoyl) transferase LipB [Cucumibacter marinus]|uniref:lipoyl(octanoyl) transferase LipB n=1 Tax=Cucumibacter marinus TaxID=1121252 RepID=UPI0004073D39|nr:lipoyl(octanoyl) transferase LipB [Cucumibacter marinus]